MTDRLTPGLAALDREPVPLAWNDVEARLANDPTPKEYLDSPRLPLKGPRRARMLVAATVALLVGGSIAVLAVRDGADHEPLRTGPVGSTTSLPSTGATTTPASGSYWPTAATAWTGTEYLVWGGRVWDGLAQEDGIGRADGWRYDPASGQVRAITPAPIAPRDEAAGAWTGTELIVCCGIPIGEGAELDTASAAAYDPEVDRWRELAPPPPETLGYNVGATWTGSDILVVTAVEGPGYSTIGLRLHAYDPTTDSWSRRADANGGDRIGDVVWTGEQLIVWTTGYTSTPSHDRGQLYDPAGDTWTDLPELPRERRPWYASAAWVDDQLVVWGIDQVSDLATVGYRWRPGETTWRPMAEAPVEVEDWGEWTPGSQTFAVDPDTGRLLVVAVHPGGTGDERGDDMRALLTYDPVADRWAHLGEVPALGYDRWALAAHGQVLRANRDDPVAFEVPE